MMCCYIGLCSAVLHCVPCSMYEVCFFGPKMIHCIASLLCKNVVCRRNMVTAATKRNSPICHTPGGEQLVKLESKSTHEKREVTI